MLKEETATRLSAIEIQPLDFTDLGRIVAMSATDKGIEAFSALRPGVRTIPDEYTGLYWTHTRQPLPSLSPTARFTLFGSPKPLDVGVSKVVSNPFIKEQSITNQERTFYNWVHLSDEINALMISDDEHTRTWAASYGLQTTDWMEYEPSLKVPTYRGLFMAALRATKSDVVGLANGDTLFSGDLVQTLAAVMDYAHSNNFLKVFITGRRTNAQVPISTQFESADGMHRTIDTITGCGTLFIEYSQDYFFVSRDLWSWDTVPQMVLGGVAFDNWFVTKMQARADVLNVDATKTVTCVHQDHPNFSHSADNKRTELNLNLAKKAGGYGKGGTYNLKYETAWVDGRVEVVKRAPLVKRPFVREPTTPMPRNLPEENGVLAEFYRTQ